MTEVEKAYIAGIIDGEGSIMLQKFNKNEFPSPCISIASTTLELLNWIVNTTHCRKIIHKKNYNKEKHKDCYSYVVKYNNAINLLSEIYPYLIIESKKKRAEMIINKYKALTPRNGRYTNKQLLEKQKFYLEFLAIN